MSFSNISIVGNLTRDPEMYIFQESNRKKTTMTVAVNIWTKGKGNKLEKTADFYKVEAWDNLAQLTKEYLSKGSQVAVSGRLQMESWLDKEGKNRVTPTVKANQIALPQKGNSKPPDASSVSNGGAVAEAASGGTTEGDEFDPKEFPRAAGETPIQANASSSNDASKESAEYLYGDEENKPDDDLEISQDFDFSKGVSQLQESVPPQPQQSVSPPQENQPAPQFGQTMKVVETTNQNPPPTIEAIANGLRSA